MISVKIRHRVRYGLRHYFREKKMLVLERKSGESIVIHNGYDIIEIKVDKNLNKGSVKLIFDAPMKYVILRKELTDN